MHAMPLSQGPRRQSFPYLSSGSEGHNESVGGQWHLHFLLNKARKLEGSGFLEPFPSFPNFYICSQLKVWEYANSFDESKFMQLERL